MVPLPIRTGRRLLVLDQFQRKPFLTGAAQRGILVTDHTKLGRVFLSHVAPIDVVHEIVTDSGLPTEVRQVHEARGMRVHVAPAGHPRTREEVRRSG